MTKLWQRVLEACFPAKTTWKKSLAVNQTEIDFTVSTPGQYCRFEYGDNQMAHFKGAGKFVRHGDIVCVKMSSGKIGRYELYSLIQTSREGWDAIGKLVGYKENAANNEGRAKGVIPIRPRVYVDTS